MSAPTAVRTYVVTGASQGIGRAIALGLAARGPGRIALVARRREALERVAEEVGRTGQGMSACLHPADLGLQTEVRRVSAEILAEHPRVDALVNNAGAWFHRREETSEGVERTVALNVFAPVLLTELLRPALRAAAPSRVVMISSEAHQGQRLDLADLELRRGYRGMRAYGRSKLALVELTRALAERYRADRIDVNAVHPGFVASGFGQNNPGAIRVLIRFLEAIAGRSTERGADTPVYLATEPGLAGTTGRYFADRKEVASSRSVDTPGEVKALWEYCAARLGAPLGP